MVQHIDITANIPLDKRWQERFRPQILRCMQWVPAGCDGGTDAAIEGSHEDGFGHCACVGVCQGCERDETGFGDFADYLGVAEDSGGGFGFGWVAGGWVETGGYVEAAVVCVFEAFFEFSRG